MFVVFSGIFPNGVAHRPSVSVHSQTTHESKRRKAMGFNYGREKRKFDKEWERLEAEYAAAGMDEAAIMAMKLYDWKWFCSERVYHNRVQTLPNESYRDEEERSTLFQKFTTLFTHWDDGDVDQSRYGWLSGIENEELFRRLCKLSQDDMELLTLLMVDGYRQVDIARIKGCSRNVISKRLKKIKKILLEG